jgi:hypothetical protein
MPVVKRTVYIDQNVDRCVDETYFVLRRRKTPRASYSLALNMMLAANILESVYSNGMSDNTRKRLSTHSRHPVKSPVTDTTVEAFSKRIIRDMEDILQNTEP